MEDQSLKWDATMPRGHWLASQHLETATSQTDFRIDGWLAATGTSVWFGAGSTGKTQLLLWMAATIASTARPVQWLGQAVNGTGHILILTAEDSREHIIGRLRDIVLHTLCQDEETAKATCDRLHVMPFLSMTETEFKHPSASLMQVSGDRIWEPTAVLLEIRRYIEHWNNQHEGQDRIVGVIMDSATSMAGFDTIDGHATTNFFFYLGRMCETLGIFWTVIGHQPKSVTIGKDTRLNASARLRGAAMWTTAPRMTVEVRLAQEWTKPKRREAEHIRAAHPHRPREDFVVVYVAKANLMGVHREERYLLRSAEGAFTDVTAPAPKPIAHNIFSASAEASKTPGSSKPKREPKQKPSKEWSQGTALVRTAVRAMFPEAKSGTEIAAANVLNYCREQYANDPALALVKSANKADRAGAINWHLDRIVDAGLLSKRLGRFKFVEHPDWNIGVDTDQADLPAQESGVK